MKILFKVIFILLVLISFSFSQIISNYGIKAAIVSSYLNETLKTDNPYIQKIYNKKKIGPAFGMFFHFLNFDFLNIESEFIYIQKGGHAELKIRTLFNPENSKTHPLDRIYEFLQMNINLCPKLGFHKFDLYGLFGISGNYLLSTSGPYPELKSEDFVIGYNLGAGVTLNNLLKYRLLFEIVYNNDFQTSVEDIDRKAKNENFQFRIGIFL